MNQTIFSLDDLGTPHTEALGWQWAYGCFETFVWSGGKVIGLELHVERLLHGCRKLGLGPSFPPEELPSRILSVLQGYPYGAYRVRIEAVLDDPSFLGAGKPPFAMRLGVRLVRLEETEETPDFSVKVLGKSKPELVEPNPGFKPLDYAARMAARNELARRGVKEGLVVGPDGNVIGGLVTNFFVSMDGERWSTPALSSGCLPGVTRHLLLNEVEGIAIAAGTVRRDELKEAASAFVANSILGVQPVHRLFLGNRSWKTLAPGPAQAVREAYLLAFA